MLYNPFLHSPGRALLGSVLITILLGYALLSLPQSQHMPLKPIDVLFTATSATCVTGLLTIPLDMFTGFGKVIILILMQIGGLGLITLTVFLMSLFLNIGLSTQRMAGELFEVSSIKTSKKMIGFIVLFTGLMEIIGSIAVFCTIYHHYPLKKALFYSVFHAISAFCSAGFTLLGPNMHSWYSNIPLLLITAILVLVGGLGFITWHEILLYFKSLKNKRHFHLSLHSRIVLIITTAIICFTIIMLWLLEYKHSLAQLPYITAAINLVFNAISYSSAGFTTLDMSTMHLATYFLIMIIAFIGSSPGSTGSGIKTTTFAVFLGTIRSVVMGKTVVEIKGRRIPNDQVFKAMAVLSLSLTWVAITMFCLLLTEEGWRFVDIMFEAFSAFTNLGLSAGITKHLSYLGKIIVMLSMIVGRIGSLTLIIALKRKQERAEFTYPEERIMIG